MREPDAAPVSTPRLFALLAREAPVGVIFRRGPSKKVQMIRWDRSTDRLQHGQWFHGRIYEHRCDLSPSGMLLIYFAAKYRGPLGTWTAISKPPYFTALALWPKGDAWGGGGMFADENTVLLNHSSGHFTLADGFRLKRGMRLKPFGPWAGRGEDDPLHTSLCLRDGWAPIGNHEERMRSAIRHEYGWRFEEPPVREKIAKGGRRLQQRLHGIALGNRPWYATSHLVLDGAGAPLIDLPGTEWADWDGNDLVFTRDGCLYRLSKGNVRRYRDRGDEALKLIGDFNASRLTTVVAPGKARVW